MIKKKNTFFTLLATSISLFFSGVLSAQTSVPTGTITGVTVKSIEGNNSIEKGEAIQLLADVQGSGFFDQTVTWNLSDSNAGILTQSGLFISSEGYVQSSVKITATSVGDPSLASDFTLNLSSPGTRVVYVSSSNPSPGDGSIGDPYTSIQKAISSAGSGYTIKVSEGTYSENISINLQKNIYLLGGFYESFTKRSIDHVNNVSRIQSPSRSNHCISWVDSSSQSLHVIDGFTITAGSKGIAYYDYANNGFIVISNNLIDDNGTVSSNRGDQGGGISITGIQCYVLYNTISNNKAGWGAGAALSRLKVMQGNIIENNVSGSDHCGGVYISAKTGLFTKNIVRKNTANNMTFYGWAGGILVDGERSTEFDETTYLEMSYNEYTENYCKTLGGGVFIDEGHNIRMHHENVHNNDTASGEGKNIYVDGSRGTPNAITKIYASRIVNSLAPYGIGNLIYTDPDSEVEGYNLEASDIQNRPYHSEPNSKITIGTSDPVIIVANAGPDQTVTDSDGDGSEIVTLDGSKSSVNKGSIVSYQWSDKDTTEIATGVSPSVTLGVGVNQITLVVTDAAGNKANDSVEIKVTGSNSPPTVPANLKSTQQTKDSITLSWDASTDDSQVANYRIDETSLGKIAVVDGGSLSFIHSGLSPKTSYTYTVTAIDDLGAESSPSTPLTVSTADTDVPPPPPPPPSPEPGNNWYISPSGNDANPGTSDKPWATFGHAYTKMASGDNLIVKDGIYYGNIRHNFGNGLPNGTKDNYTVVRAENDFKVIIDASKETRLYAAALDFNGASYVRIEGIKFRGRGSGDDSTPGAGNMNNSDHIKVMRCAFYGAPDRMNASVVSASSGCKYILFEDCWAFGTGRYKFMTFGDTQGTSEKVIFRRCVARHDYHTSNGPPAVAFWGRLAANFQAYSATDFLFQNCIAIDSGNPDRTKSYTENLDVYGDIFGAFFFENKELGGSGLPNRGQVQDSIVINVNTRAAFRDVNQTGKRVISNSLVLGTRGGYHGRVMKGNPELVLNNLSFIDIWGTFQDLSYAFGTGVFVANPQNSSVTYINSNMQQCNSYGIANYATTNYNNYHKNGANFGNSFGVTPPTQGPNDTFLDPSYVHPTRAAPGSPLKGSASDGGDKGATIMFKRGVSGTLWGEPGYNTLTDEPLWPFPYENEIKKDMAASSFEVTIGAKTHKIDGTRGFCAPGNGLNGQPITLTSYIWEYLGSPCPPEIYFGTGGGPTTYESWAKSKGLVGNNALRQADPDKDGINNFQEFALGGNPLKNDSALIAPFFNKNKDGTSMTYFYKKAIDNLIYQVEHSSNLTNWSKVKSIENFDPATGRYSKTYNIPPGESKVFLRLVIKEK